MTQFYEYTNTLIDKLRQSLIDRGFDLSLGEKMFDDATRRGAEYMARRLERDAPAAREYVETCVQMNNQIDHSLIECMAAPSSCELDVVVELEFPDVPQMEVVSPLASALATVGIQVGEGYVCPKGSNCRRDFRELDNITSYYYGELIVFWDIPIMGADYLMKSHLPNIQINGPSAIIHGSGNSNHVISGFREKLDGEEAIQIVAHTASGRRIGILWCGDIISRVTAHASAIYERIRVGEKDIYYLLSGTATDSVEVRYHQWVPITLRAMTPFLQKEGVVVRMNELEYRVKNARTMNLRVVGANSVDMQGNLYKVANIPLGVSGIIEIEIQKPRAGRYIRKRPDRDFPDSALTVQTLMKSALLLDLLPYIPDIPYVEGRDVQPVSYAPEDKSVVDHRTYHRQHVWCACYAWTQRSTSPGTPTHLPSVAKEIYDRLGRVDGDLIQGEMASRHLHAVGTQMMRSCPILLSRKIIVRRCMVLFEDNVCECWISNVPLRTTFFATQVKYSNLSRVTREASEPWFDRSREFLLVYMSLPCGKPELAVYSARRIYDTLVGDCDCDRYGRVGFG